MKKILVVLVVLLGLYVVARADWKDDAGYVDPLSGYSSAATLTIANAGTGKRNCVTDLTFVANNNVQLSILEGKGTLASLTTTYSMIVSSGVPFIESWSKENPFCGIMNSTMSFYTTKLENGTAAQYRINVNGYTRSK